MTQSRSLCNLVCREDVVLLKSMGVLSSPHCAAAAHCADDFCRTAGRQAAVLAGLHGALRGTRVRGSCLNWSPHRRSLGDLESSEATELLLKNVSVLSSPFRAAAAHCAADFLRGRLSARPT